MKLDLKKMRLVAVSFCCGFIVCAVLIGPSPTRQNTPRIVASGPLLAATQFQPQTVPLIWTDSRRVRMIPREGDAFLDPMQLGPERGSGRNVDLIDTRYEFEVGDLK